MDDAASRLIQQILLAWKVTFVSCPCIMIKTIVLPAWTMYMQEKRTLTGTHGTHNAVHYSDQSSPDRVLQRQKSMEYTIQLRDYYSGDKTDHSNFYDAVENQGELLTNQSNERTVQGKGRQH